MWLGKGLNSLCMVMRRKLNDCTALLTIRRLRLRLQSFWLLKDRQIFPFTFHNLTMHFILHTKQLRRPRHLPRKHQRNLHDSLSILRLQRTGEKTALKYTHLYLTIRLYHIESVNEYQLQLGKKRQVWFILLADVHGCASKTVRFFENMYHT